MRFDPETFVASIDERRRRRPRLVRPLVDLAAMAGWWALRWLADRDNRRLRRQDGR